MIIRGQYCRLRPCWGAVCALGQCGNILPFSPFHIMETLYPQPIPWEWSFNQILSSYKITSVQNRIKELQLVSIKFPQGYSLEYRIQFWTLSYRKGINKLKWVQWRGTKTVRSTCSVRESWGSQPCSARRNDSFRMTYQQPPARR